MATDGLPSMCDPRLTDEGAEFRLWPEVRRWSIVEEPIRARKGRNGRHSYWLGDEPVAKVDVPGHALRFFVVAFRHNGVEEALILPDKTLLPGEFDARTWKRIRVPLRAATDRLYTAAPQLVAV